jgi:glycosyltransferase involved in cell wall biosynthesis
MIVVAPSVIQEPFGLPVVEAMAAGRPVVASRVGGIPELVAHGRTGLLVEPAEPAALADALLSLLGAPERCRAMGAAGRQDVTAHWSWQLAAHRLRAVYVSLVAENAPS